MLQYIHGMCELAFLHYRLNDQLDVFQSDFEQKAAALRMLSDGVYPVHLLLMCRSLDEVMSVGLSDDFKQVSLNVSFHTCVEG